MGSLGGVRMYRRMHVTQMPHLFQQAEIDAGTPQEFADAPHVLGMVQGDGRGGPHDQ